MNTTTDWYGPTALPVSPFAVSAFSVVEGPRHAGVPSLPRPVLHVRSRAA
jgi:hypothetical protein